MATSRPDDRAALFGLNEVRTAFDVTMRLAFIDMTHESLIQQGVATKIAPCNRNHAHGAMQTNTALPSGLISTGKLKATLP